MLDSSMQHHTQNHSLFIEICPVVCVKEWILAHSVCLQSAKLEIHPLCNFFRYAMWGTMVPSSLLMGLSAAPLWTAQSSYFTIVAEKYASVNKETKDAVVARFFGIFFCIFQLCEY